MPFRILRNDITEMDTEAIVNTANAEVAVGSGCDSAVYRAAGYEELLNYRREHIGKAREGEAFLTPGFRLKAKYIIHAVSPRFLDGEQGEEKKLRSCYRNSLRLAKEQGIRSIAFPLIATGGFGYPKEEGLRIAVDEISAFLMNNELEVCLVVFDETSAGLGERLYPGLEAYIDRHYVREAEEAEYGERRRPSANRTARLEKNTVFPGKTMSMARADETECCGDEAEPVRYEAAAPKAASDGGPCYDFEEEHLGRLNERMKHLSDSYSQYLLYLIREKHMENADVYRRAIVDKKIFSKIKNNVNYHPNKLTALCLCVGAMLNLDEAKDLLARAGYALSPCDKTDIIFSYFLEHGIYDMIELDIQLEEHGLPCIIE